MPKIVHHAIYTLKKQPLVHQNFRENTNQPVLFLITRNIRLKLEIVPEFD